MKPAALLPGLSLSLVLVLVLVVLSGSTACPSGRAAVPPALLTPLADRPSTTASGDSFDPVLSADGQWAVFVSGAPNLVANDVNGPALDVFARRLDTGLVELVSATPRGTSGNGRSHSPAVSADGRFVAFVSEATDLVPNDNALGSDIFLRDLVLHTTTLVSVRATGDGPGSHDSSHPVITPDGRFVAFESWASNLSLSDSNSLPDVYLRDVVGRVTHWISSPSPVASLRLLAPGPSTSPSLSDDGAVVVFRSTAQNLAPRIRGALGTLFRRRVAAKTNEMLDLWPPGPPASATGTSLGHRLTPDGRFLVAQLSFQTRVTSGVYRLDLPAATPPVLVAPDLYTHRFYPALEEASGPFISDDGRIVTFEARPTPATAAQPRLPAVYSASPEQTPLLLSTNLAPDDLNPALQRPIGELVAASPDGEWVAFVAPDPDPLATTNGLPRRLWLARRSTGELRRLGSPQPPDGAYDSPAVAFDAAGRRLLFETADPDLVPNDLNQARDVFVHDLATGQTRLVSERDPALPDRTAPHHSFASRAAFGADGRWLAFTTLAFGSVPNDPRPSRQVLVHDFLTGSNLLASARLDGTGPGSGSSWDPSLSADGRWLAFVSVATNLTAEPAVPGVENVFLRDLGTGSTELVSRTWDTGAPGRLPSHQPIVSPDGTWVAFTTLAALVPGQTTRARDVCLYHRETRTVRLLGASALPGGDPVEGNADSGNPRWSPDGRWLVFQSLAANLTPDATSTGVARWFAWDVAASTLTHLAPPAGTLRPASVLSPADAGAVISGDSRVVAFPDGSPAGQIVVRRFDPPDLVTTVPGATEPHLGFDGRRLAYRATDALLGNGPVSVIDFATGQTIPVDTAPDGQPANAPTRSYQLLAGGRWIVFTSAATNLHPAATRRRSQLFARDLVSGTVFLLSRDPDGNPANEVVGPPLPAPDGRSFAFATGASNLAPGDFNDRLDLYQVRLDEAAGGDAPVLAIQHDPSGPVLLTWPATPGSPGRLETTPDLVDPVWTRLDTLITVTAGQASAVDPAPAAGFPRRFYRVVKE